MLPDAIVNYLKGMRMSAEGVEERMEICGACELNMNGVCGKCICVIKLKAKAPKEKCPEGKWNEQ